MYEEEDDGLPLQYRRLTAHLQTGSADFNRRLAAYLASNVAMRSALDQAITSSYEQQFPNARQFSHNQPGVFPSPLMTQNVGFHPAQQPPVHGSPHSPHQYRQSPYPMPGGQGFRQPSHRAGSIGTPANFTEGTSPGPAISQQIHHRRQSMPASMHGQNQVMSPMSEHAPNSPAIASTSTTENMWQFSGQSVHPHQQINLSPFTTTLPLESQMLVGAALDPNDPFTSMLMAGGSSYTGSQFYDFNPKDALQHPNFDGINSTLAPNASNAMLSPTLGEAVPPTSEPTFIPGQTSSFDASDFKGIDCASSNSDHNGTPPIDSANAAWESYINENYQS